MSIFIKLTTILLSVILIQGRSFANDVGGFSLPIIGEVQANYDNFQGIPDGSWNSNTGGVIGANFGLSMCDLIGVQAGGSYGVYDWNGRGPVGSGHNGSVQQQGFLTAGLFSTSPYPVRSGVQAAFVIDWMFNRNFGVFGVNPSFGQLRFQVGYFLNRCSEFGIWGTASIHKDHKETFEIPISFRAIDQVSLFWRYNFDNCAETMLWIGVPYRRSLMFPDHTPGTFILGGSFSVPLNSCLSVVGHGVYVGPRGNSQSPRFRNTATNICIGVNYRFGLGDKADCECSTWHSYIPIANNSNFLVDTNLND